MNLLGYSIHGPEQETISTQRAFQQDQMELFASDYQQKKQKEEIELDQEFALPDNPMFG